MWGCVGCDSADVGCEGRAAESQPGDTRAKMFLGPHSLICLYMHATKMFSPSLGYL